jgi:hypothetical protein
MSEPKVVSVSVPDADLADEVDNKLVIPKEDAKDEEGAYCVCGGSRFASSFEWRSLGDRLSTRRTLFFPNYSCTSIGWRLHITNIGAGIIAFAKCVSRAEPIAGLIKSSGLRPGQETAELAIIQSDPNSPLYSKQSFAEMGLYDFSSWHASNQSDTKPLIGVLSCSRESLQWATTSHHAFKSMPFLPSWLTRA